MTFQNLRDFEMTTQTEAQQIADELENTPFQSTRYEAAAELRRLDKIEAEWAALSQDDGKAQREIERLEAANAELLAALVDVSYTLEKARIWGGMDWTYNPLHPVHYLPARDKARAAIAKHIGAA
jgi:hypothetical protein